MSRLLLFDQKVHWHAQRAGEFLLQFGGPFASASFDLGQVVLADADRYGQLALNHVAPFADDTHRVIAVCESISHGFWQHDFAAFLEGTRGTADDPARGGIFLRLGGEGDQSIIFDARQYGEIVVLALIVNKTRQTPERNRIPAAPLSAFTSPTPVSANAFNLRSICARVVAVSCAIGGQRRK